MTMVDPNSRIAFAVAIPTKHSKHTAKVLEALIDGLSDGMHEKAKDFSILSDNGSEFMKEFDALIEQKGLQHYWTYPRSPKMNAPVQYLLKDHDECHMLWTNTKA